MRMATKSSSGLYYRKHMQINTSTINVCLNIVPTQPKGGHLIAFLLRQSIIIVSN